MRLVEQIGKRSDGEQHAAQLPHQEQSAQQEPDRHQARGRTRWPRQNHRGQHRNEQGVPICRRVEELHERQGRRRQPRAECHQRTARPQQQKHQHGLGDGGKRERVAQAHQVRAPDAKRCGVGELNIPGVQVLDVAVEDIAGDDPICDVRVHAFVGWPPELVVEVDDDGKRSGHRHQQQHDLPTREGNRSRHHRSITTGAARRVPMSRRRRAEQPAARIRRPPDERDRPWPCASAI